MAGTVVEKLIIEIAGDAKKFKQELKTLQKTNKDGEASFKKMALVGKAAFLAVGAAATVMAVASTKAFIEFEKGFTGVVKTTNLAGEDLEAFKHEIMSLSEEIPQTTTQLLEIATAAGQLGIQGTKSLTIFTETIAKLGATTDLEGGEAAVAIARILNLTGEGTETVDTFGAAIVDLGNNFATSESQILEVAKEVAKATVNFNLSSPEILGMSAAMSSLGIAAEAGSTVVSKAFMKIDEVIRSQAGPQFEKLIELTGMTGDQLTKTFETDAVSVFESFIIGLGEAGESGKSMAAELNELGLSGIRVEKILPSLAKRSDILSAALKRSSTAASDNTALNKEAALAFETTSSKMTIAGNKVNNLAIGLGEKLAPALIKVTDALLHATGLSKTLSEQILETASDVDILTASFDDTGEATKLLVEETQKQMALLDAAAGRSFQNQKQISEDSIKDKEETAAKSEAIAVAAANEAERIEAEKLEEIKTQQLEFAQSMKDLSKIIFDELTVSTQAFADIDYVSVGNKFEPIETAVGNLKNAFDKLNVSSNAFASTDYTPTGKGNPFGGDRGPGKDFKGPDGKGTFAGFGAGSIGVVTDVAESVASQITGVSGAISGFANGGGVQGAINGFVTEMLLSNEEFQEAIGELNAIIQEAFGPIIHELIPVLKAVGVVLEAISPALSRIAPFIGPLTIGVIYVAEAVDQLSDAMGGLDEGLQSLEEVGDKLLEPLAKLETALIDTANILLDPLESIVGPLEELVEPLDAILGPLEEMVGPLEELVEPLVGFSTSIDDLEAGFESIIEPLEALINPINNLTAWTATLKNSIDFLKTPVDALSTPLGSLKSSVDGLAAPINRLAEIINNFNPFGGSFDVFNPFSRAVGSPGLKQADLLRLPGMEKGSGLIQAHEDEIIIPADFKVNLGMRTPSSNMQFQDLSKSGSGTGGAVNEKVTFEIIVKPDEMTEFFSAKQREQIDLGTSKQ